MSDFDRYGGPDFDERQRERARQRQREPDPDLGRGGRTSFFSSDREAGETRRDRPRERMFRDNRPSGTGSGGGAFSRDRDPQSETWDRDVRNEGRDRDHQARGSESRDRNDDDRRQLPIDETDQLIASNKVEGTPVYGREGERLGTIYNFMVDKFSGRVEYAVMSYGGFLGVGHRYFPLPWRILSYDTREGGYHVDMDYRDMERAPSFGREDEPRFNRDYGRRVHSWYGLDY